MPAICCGADQAATPPVGSVEVRTLPAQSVATQKEAVGHEMPLRPYELESTPVAAIQAAAPPVGSVEVTMSPALSTTTHSVIDGHEMFASAAVGSAPSTMLQDPAWLGFVDTTTAP